MIFKVVKNMQYYAVPAKFTGDIWLQMKMNDNEDFKLYVDLDRSLWLNFSRSQEVISL